MEMQDIAMFSRVSLAMTIVKLLAVLKFLMQKRQTIEFRTLKVNEDNLKNAEAETLQWKVNKTRRVSYMSSSYLK